MDISRESQEVLSRHCTHACGFADDAAIKALLNGIAARRWSAAGVRPGTDAGGIDRGHQLDPAAEPLDRSRLLLPDRAGENHKRQIDGRMQFTIDRRQRCGDAARG